MALKLITPPASEPVSLAEARLHLRISDDQTDEDTLIESLIVAARESAEHMTGRAFLPQTWELALDGFEDEILLNKSPLVSVESVKYVDEDGTQQTMDESDYLVDSHSEPARFLPAYGTCWPATRCQPNAVLVRFEAGYADADTVPAQIKSWMLLRIGTLYEHRESIVNGTISQDLANAFADRLLDAVKVY